MISIKFIFINKNKVILLFLLIAFLYTNNSYAQFGGFLDKLKKDIENIVLVPLNTNSEESKFTSVGGLNNNLLINFDDLSQIDQTLITKTNILINNKNFCDLSKTQKLNMCLGMELRDYLKITNSLLFAPSSIIQDPEIKVTNSQILCEGNSCVRNFGDLKRTVEIIAKEGVGQPTISALARGGVAGSSIDRSNQNRSCVGKGCEELLKQSNKPQKGTLVTIEDKQSNVCHMVFPSIYSAGINVSKNTYSIEEVLNDKFEIYKFNIIDCSFGEYWGAYKVVKKYRFFTNKLIGMSTELYIVENDYDRIESSRFMSILADETKKTYEPFTKIFNENQINILLIKDKSKMVMLDEELQSLANSIGSKYYTRYQNRSSKNTGRTTTSAGGNFYKEQYE